MNKSSKKEPKKTKKQLRLEAQERAKEEQRKKEEAERQRLEEEERKRQENERLRRLEEEKLSREERERLTEEEPEMRSWMMEFKKAWTLAEMKINEVKDWEKYKKCDSKHDVNHEPDVTNYLSFLQELPKVTLENAKTIVSQLQYTEDIMRDMTCLYYKARSERDPKREKWCTNYIKAFRAITSKKLEEVTSAYAINADILVEQKTAEQSKKATEQASKMFKQDPSKNQEIVIQHTFNDVKYGIWINPSATKNISFKKPAEFNEFGFTSEIPRPFSNNPLIMRVFWTAYDNLWNYDNYMKEFVVGGVFDIGCFVVLPMPKAAKTWKMKPDYEIEDSLQRQVFNALDYSGANYEVKMFYTLPPYVYVHPTDKIRIAIWDNAQWTSENIIDINYDQEKRSITFKTYKMAPHCFIQDRIVDFPYVNFRLRCIRKEQRALMDIQTKRLKFRFKIGPGWVKLIQRPEPEFAHIVKKKLPPHALLSELLACGVNLLPVSEDATTANIIGKSMDAEENAIQNLALAVQGFYIKSTKWNLVLPGDRVLVFLHENVENDEEFLEDQPKDWRAMVFYSNRVTCIKARDEADILDEGPYKDCLTHANMEILCQKHEIFRPEPLMKMKEMSYVVFVETLRRFMKLTRVLSFTLS